MGVFKRHGECKYCASKDNVAVYEDNSAHCFGCGKNYRNYDMTAEYTKKSYNFEYKLTLEEVNTYPYAQQTKRRVSPEVYNYYGIRMSINQTTGEAYGIFYPGYIKGELSGFKVRLLPKSFKHPSVGCMEGVDPFGWQTIRGFKKLIIVEGEEDVCAVQEMIRSYWGGRGKDVWANVISPPMGVSSLEKMCESKHNELNKFEEIVFIPDNDKDKKKAITTITNFIDYQKLKVIDVPTKDSSDMLQEGREQEWLSLYFKAVSYRPSSILSIKDTLPLVLEKKITECFYYPPEWKKLNFMSMGRRLGEFDILSAGTGCGKSFLIKEIINNDILTTNLKTGIISLEESPRDTIVGLMSLKANKRLLDPNISKDVSNEEFTKYWKQVSQDGRVHVVNHEGTLTENEVIQNVTYLASCYGCKFIYIDNLGNIIPDKRTSNSLAESDLFIERLRSLALKLQVWICLVVHLRKNSLNSRSFESGAIPTESDLYGTSGLSRKSFCILAIQRNKHHSDEDMRNVARLHVIKCRFLGSGRTGPADFLKFNQETGRLEPIPKPEKDIQEPLEESKAMDI